MEGIVRSEMKGKSKQRKTLPEGSDTRPAGQPQKVRCNQSIGLESVEKKIGELHEKAKVSDITSVKIFLCPKFYAVQGV